MSNNNSSSSLGRMDRKTANPELQLEVDVIILEYLVFTATAAILSERRSQLAGNEDDHSADQAIIAADSCIKIMRVNHPDFEPSGDVRFRLDLLQFAVLFCRRMERDFTTPSRESLQQLRQQHIKRASTFHDDQYIADAIWLPFASNTCLYMMELKTQVQEGFPCLHSLSGQTLDAFDYVPLLDLLPLFMATSVQVIAEENITEQQSVSPQWLNLAKRFMIMAFLDSWDHGPGCSGELDKLLHEAIAWGDFLDADGYSVDVEGWDSTRIDALEELMTHPQHGMPDPDLTSVAKSLITFDADVVSFLQDLSKSIESPVLVQIEQGELRGLTKAETEAFKHKVGL